MKKVLETDYMEDDVEKPVVIKPKLTDEQLDALLADWFERDEKTFVRIDQKNRLAWEATLSEEDSYSAYLLAAPTDKELFIRSYGMAKDFLVVMMLPTRPTLKLEKNGHKSYTNGKHIVVSTNVFDEDGMSNGDKLDVFFGLVVHEGCHVKYTDFEEYAKIDKRYENEQVYFHIKNILEDERIEIAIGGDSPGLARFIECSKYFYFDRLYKKMETKFKKEGKEKNAFEKIMDAFLSFIRYPKYVKKEDFEIFGDKIYDIKNVLVPYPTSTKEISIATGKVYDIIRDLLAEAVKEKEEIGEGEDGDEEGDEEEGSLKPRKPLTEDEKESAEKMMKDMSEELMKMLDKLSVKFSEDAEKSPEESRILEIDKLLISELEGIVERPSKNVVVIKEENGEAVYAVDKAVIRKYIPAIAKQLKNHAKEYKIVHRSMRSGVLDTSKLAEAYQGVQTVYSKEGEVKTSGINVCVLIDESGSMGYDKATKARQSAVLLREALMLVPNVNLFIYGHSADSTSSGATELYVYQEPGIKHKYSLGNSHARCENRDGIAIYESAKRVRKFNKKPTIMFILSDGEPSAAAYRGIAAIEDTRDKVLQVEKMDFQVIQICIDKGYEPGKMFKKFLIMTDWNTLAIDLGKVVKKAVLKLSPIIIS